MKQEEQKNKKQQKQEQQQKAEDQDQEKKQQQEQEKKQQKNNKQAQNKQEEQTENQEPTQEEKQEEQRENEQREDEQKEEVKEDKKTKGQKKSREKGKEKKEKKEKTDAEKLAELNDKYLRLTAEYDNYRRRTLREKMELSKTAGEEILQSMLPVMDDFDRALESIDESQDIEAVKEGIHLIYNKFKEVLELKGVKEIEAKDQEFDTDKHEAVSKIPAPSEDMKGKVVDVVQKGYYLNDKVLRFSKVVVGE